MKLNVQKVVHTRILIVDKASVLRLGEEMGVIMNKMDFDVDYTDIIATKDGLYCCMQYVEEVIPVA